MCVCVHKSPKFNKHVDAAWLTCDFVRFITVPVTWPHSRTRNSLCASSLCASYVYLFHVNLLHANLTHVNRPWIFRVWFFAPRGSPTCDSLCHEILRCVSLGLPYKSACQPASLADHPPTSTLMARPLTRPPSLPLPPAAG